MGFPGAGDEGNSGVRKGNGRGGGGMDGDGSGGAISQLDGEKMGRSRGVFFVLVEAHEEAEDFCDQLLEFGGRV